MTRTFKIRRAAVALIPLAGLFALAACGGGETEGTEEVYKTDVEDVGGGELIVEDANPDAVEANLPETPMKPVPEEGESAPAGE